MVGSSIDDVHKGLTIVVLTSLGERMSTEDVDELLKGVDCKNDTVNYFGKLFQIACPKS